MVRQHSTRRRLFFTWKLDFKIWKKKSEMVHWSIDLYGAETLTLWKVGHPVKNEEVLHRVKEQRNILHAVRRRKANWTGHILRRNGLLNHVNE